MVTHEVSPARPFLRLLVRLKEDSERLSSFLGGSMFIDQAALSSIRQLRVTHRCQAGYGP
jgi:hypothetical protein